ncbi:MAG: hypothetical protein A2015_10260 [Spirochaetes bacterium GWF1_31_7]|nr:MAG: hypothetical protein A2Y30_05895 [Spirochaetes bacterium GWE1_32_154]OHD49520.1 MAG: hypothetical protein A2Y29_01955 [Spirochaetes bacterium GWE2_31_10]OHD49713.1 MAG: hypothetical protein A2015_10260 [Spirochaetes bacterium GWF1_31_7]HBD95691.1 hypothetical protein [Spirochaetia bacterium]HBI38953.1 hypothetical protein [Spirochaetia bacterium]
MEELNIFDYDKLLENYYNEEKIINEVLMIFTNTVRSQLEELKVIMASEPIDIGKIRFIAHSIKGSAHNLTCMKLGDIAFDVQKACDEENTELIKQLLTVILPVFKETYEKIQRYLSI